MALRTTFFILAMLACLSSSAQRRMVAEWEPAYGTLIRWPLGITGDLVVELARNDSVYVLVENPGQQAQATSVLTSYGVSMNHVRFVTANTYSHWTRDWGPHYVFDENGNAAIADPMFDGYPWVPGCNGETGQTLPGNTRGYEEDDAVNQALAGEFGLPLIDFPAYLTGGNIMTDGHGLAYSTQQMLDESAPFCNEVCFRNQAGELLGISDYSLTLNPEVYGIQHIDCYAKLLDEERVLVKRLPAGHPEYQCVEQLANFFRGKINCYGRNYEVHRIYCPVITGDEVPAYTNSLILNKKVLVPLFGIDEDEQALQTYRDLMPGYEVTGFGGSWYYYDALHCRTMGIFDPAMLMIWHKPPRLAAAGLPHALITRVTDYSRAGLVSDSLFLYWKEEGLSPWHNTPLISMPETDSLYALVPGFPDGTKIRYYFSVADSSGRHETLPRTAPAAGYSLEFSDLITGGDEVPAIHSVVVSPLPFSDLLNVSFVGQGREPISIQLLDGAGSVVRQSLCGASELEKGRVEWNTSGLAAGCYVLTMSAGGKVFSKKLIKL